MSIRRRCLPLIALSLTACFPFGVSEHRIIGTYFLVQWEDFRTYYLRDHRNEDWKAGVSIIGGVVTYIGWNDRYIVAVRKPFASSELGGAMIVEVSSGRVTGPFTHWQIASNSKVSDIDINRVDYVWKDL